ncbi:hypothetical protein [Rhizobium rhizosphaerae]|uniref:hypothetical protein n=1 Tax=Xaviernesmea rhizosphaerae TaxID=1672749 RepID=UPI001179E256|nr:hypothetical protein [Xaviernesmea rhizosphaerae]
MEGARILFCAEAAELARDLATLIASGYRLKSVTRIDHCLWSAHVKAVERPPNLNLIFLITFNNKREGYNNLQQKNVPCVNFKPLRAC